MQRSEGIDTLRVGKIITAAVELARALSAFGNLRN
jgi:hypothetical protein